MGEKAMLGLLSLSGRNMAESVPRHLGRSKFHRIFIVSEQFITLLSCLLQYSCVDEIICWCLYIEDDRVLCSQHTEIRALPVFLPHLWDNFMEFILLPFTFGSYEMVGVSNYQMLKIDSFICLLLFFFYVIIVDLGLTKLCLP